MQHGAYARVRVLRVVRLRPAHHATPRIAAHATSEQMKNQKWCAPCRPEPRKHSTPNGGHTAFDISTRSAPGAQMVLVTTGKPTPAKNAPTINTSADPTPSPAY